MQKHFYALVVPPESTKRAKTALEAQNLLNKDIKISPVEDVGSLPARCMRIPLLLEAHPDLERTVLDSSAQRQLQQLCRDSVPELANIDFTVTTLLDTTSCLTQKGQNPLQRAFAGSLDLLVETSHDVDVSDGQQLISDFPESYVIYQPLLLLPVSYLDNKSWNELIGRLRRCSADFERFFTDLVRRVGVTHVAINAPVPSQNTSGPEGLVDNLIRSPSKIQILYGDFGPDLPAFPHHRPTAQDFEKALWVTAKQNDITQIWAPRYTMFSGGNVTEKKRLLDLPTVTEAVQQGVTRGRGSAAVDLFCGVGYFAFSYAKAGISKVLCWDINPWSIEGLRRGAAANKWSSATLSNHNDAKELLLKENSEYSTGSARSTGTFLLFCETNELARGRIEAMRAELPPIRHVNCGALPTAGETWKTAIDIMDPDLGGWLHLHESVLDKDASRVGELYAARMQAHFETLHPEAGLSDNLKLVGTSRVKSMGPRLWHHVLDIWIPPRQLG